MDESVSNEAKEHRSVNVGRSVWRYVHPIIRNTRLTSMSRIRGY